MAPEFAEKCRNFDLRLTLRKMTIGYSELQDREWTVLNLEGDDHADLAAVLLLVLEL